MVTESFVPVALHAINKDSQLKKILPNIASLSLATELSENHKSNPTHLGQLTNEQTHSSKLSISVAGKLGIPFGSTEGSFSRKIFVQEYAKFVDILKGQGKVRWGIAIRWISNIKVIDIKANISSLPVISASAQLGYVEASCKFQAIGMSSKRITELMPSDVQLSIESYVEMNNKLEDIKKEIWSDKTTISPTVLSIYSSINNEVENNYQEAIAASWALNRIQDGKTLGYALNEDPIHSLESQSTIKSVYVDIVESDARDTKPSKQAIRKSKSILNGMTIKI